MKTKFFYPMVCSLILLLEVVITCFSVIKAQNVADTVWTEKSASAWFASNVWANGLVLKGNDLISKQLFACQYQKHTDYWNKAFSFLKDSDLVKIKPGKYFLDGDNVFVTVTEGPVKQFEETRWEAHRKYADIQLVSVGQEKMGIAPLNLCENIVPYVETKDIGFYTLAEQHATFFIANPGWFVIFFPQNVHRPGIRINDCLMNKKIVVKVKVD